MNEETKKISFAFSKFVKKTQIVPSKISEVKPEESKVQLIDCLEGKSIKLKEKTHTEDTVLVIPLKRTTDVSTTISDHAGYLKLAQRIGLSSSPKNDSFTISESPQELREIDNSKVTTLNNDRKDLQSLPLTLDEIAAKEIMDDLNKTKMLETKNIFTVPLTNNPPAGEKESSLEDYESIPVTDFGLAMLRGMGWSPGKGIGKNEKLITPSLPTLRPKGMGLGADKVINKEIVSKPINHDLKMAKGSFIRVIAGPYKDSYGQVEGFDDEAGRLIVKLAIKNISLSLNEFMVQLVDKAEFTKNSKVINVGKYEEYKDTVDKKIKNEASSSPEDHLQNRSRERNKSGSKSPVQRPINTHCIVSNDKFSEEKESASSQGKDSQYLSRKVSSYRDPETVNKNSSCSEDDSHSRSRHSNHSKKVSYTSKNNKISVKNEIHKTKKYSKRKLRSSSESSSSTCSESEKYSREYKYKKKSSTNKHESSSSSSCESDKYSRKYNYKKKSRSHKHNTRSRSRSPRKHAKIKKHKSR